MLKLPAPELNVRSVMGLVSYLTAMGIDTSSVLAAAGLHPNPQAAVPERISRTAWLAAHHEAVRVTRDPLLCLHVSAWLPFGSLDVLDYLLVRSTTVGEGMARLQLDGCLSPALRLAQTGEMNAVDFHFSATATSRFGFRSDRA